MLQTCQATDYFSRPSCTNSTYQNHLSKPSRPSAERLHSSPKRGGQVAQATACTDANNIREDINYKLRSVSGAENSADTGYQNQPTTDKFHRDEEPVNSPVDNQFVCDTLTRLLAEEKTFLYSPMLLYKLDSSSTEKIDGFTRDEAVFNLRFLHVYYNFPPETFSRAVATIDHFIMRVRVKPKYMSVVAAAAYYLAIKKQNDNHGIDCPTLEEMVSLSQCGGTVEDLNRMINVILLKFSDNTTGSTAVEFARVLMHAYGTSLVQRCANRVYSRILMALTSLQVYQFRVPTLALASLLLEVREMEVPGLLLDTSCLYSLAQLFQVSPESLEACAECVKIMYTSCCRTSLSSSRAQLNWGLSKRTRSILKNIKVTIAKNKNLNSISENNELEFEDMEV